VEVSLPTMILIAMLPIFGPILALEAVPIFMYFLFIALSALRFDFRISVFTGAAAAIEYFGLALIMLQSPNAAVTSPMLHSPAFHFGKAIILLVTGVITGLVSREIQSRIVKSLQDVDERNRVIGLFGQHVSPAVVDRLLAMDAETDGEVRPVCVMFLDIRNFTAFCENRSPQEVVAYLNTLFAPLITIVNQHHGIVNKFLGDGFLAVFGAPLAEGSAPQNAIHAALAISNHMEQIWAAGDLPKLEIGIGLHAGDAVTGTVGSAARKEYTIIGDVVNIAARIEQLNKQYGSRLLVSGDAWNAAALPDHPADCLGVVEVRGHSAGVEIYKLA
jgi:adenylate cyclase